MIKHFFNPQELEGLSKSNDMRRDFLDRVAKLDPTLDHTMFDQKSILRLMLLATLLRIDDLHIENTGTITSKDKLKLAVVDFQVDDSQENLLVDFSQINSWERLSTALYLEFAHNAGGNAWDDPVFPVVVARALKTDVRILEKAIDSIFFPRTESESKDKTNPVSTIGQHSFFQQRSETFVDTINSAYEEIPRMLIGAGVEGIELKSAVDAVSKYMKIIFANYAKLNSAVRSLKEISLSVVQQPNSAKK